ncbi:MAG: CHASE3 domain-containing protein [Chitinophagaceae bacterium]|nr:CHASE3 domain-containing protein [Chitinophagaceae bacterium]
MQILNYNFTKLILYLVLVLSVFILFFTASISYRKIVELTESEQNLIHKHLITAQLELLASDIKQAESNQRGFIITGDSTFVQTYRSAKNAAATSYQNLVQLLEKDELQKKNLLTLQNLQEDRFYYLDKNLQYSTDTLEKKLLLKRSMNAGKRTMDLLLAKINQMKNIELSLLQKRSKMYQEHAELSPKWIFISILFSLFIFICSFYKINRDLQNLKKANNQLMINKEIFEHSEQIAEISSWCWNLQSDTLTFSHNQYRMLGCEVHSFEPTTENFMEFVHPDDRHILHEGRQKILIDSSSTPVVSYFRIIRKDNNSLRYYKSIEKKIVDNYGNDIVIGINADITEQYLKDKIIEEKIFDLERSNNELSAFNHVASHDLQEPLRKVQTYISRIKERDFDQLNEKAKEYFTRVQIAANRMQKLIDDLLLFSRANKADKIFEHTDLQEIFDNAQVELAQLIEEKNARLQSTALPVIDAIPFQIQQLFNNLIGNSVKYARTHVAPVIQVSAQWLQADQIPFLHHFGKARFLELTFDDNGIGFDQQYADNIFKLFHRLHDDNSFTGTGIGLTICKKIVENHKGYIKAYGVKDQGATFKVYLPA